MDIFILSDGKEIGPFGEETARTLLKQGSVDATDLAWRTGMVDWAPLGEMLPVGNESALSDPSGETPAGSATPPSADGAPAAVKAEIEPATAKQKAFLGYLSIGIPEDLSKEQASSLLNDAMEDPASAERIGRWSAERLRLHPDLFAAEIHARKENRANHFFEICQTEGSQFFTRITKAHCQVLVSFLDARFPTWDSRMEDAATNFFFPAIAEKFPQLIERQWRGHFHYVEEPGTEPIRKAPTSRIKKRLTTPLEAVVRGFAIGAAVLAALYFGHRMIPRWRGHHPAEKAQSENSAPPSDPPPAVTSTGRPELPLPSVPDSPAPKKTRDATATQKTAVENNAAASPASPPPSDESKAGTGHPMPTGQSPAPSDSSMAASPASSSSNPAPTSAPPAADNPAPPRLPRRNRPLNQNPVLS
jgi:hypothetical protein